MRGVHARPGLRHELALPVTRDGDGMDERSRRLRQRIEDAFSGVPYPGDDDITHVADEEGVRLRERFRRRHWKEVPRDVLRHHHDHLAFFTPAALAYYLPAYLFAALDDYWDILDFVLSHLVPSRREELEGFQASVEQRFGRFTPAQRRALRAFLEYVRDELPDRCVPEEMERVLDVYWRER
jgi:hypothetical protein